MAKMVRIQSTTNITVTSGLQHKDVTNPDAHVPDRLRVSPLWPKAMVDIKRGVGMYPAEIVEWSTVKSLARDGILTIGQTEESQDNAESAELARNMKSIKSEASKKKSTTLESLVSED